MYITLSFFFIFKFIIKMENINLYQQIFSYQSINVQITYMSLPVSINIYFTLILYIDSLL